MLSWLTVFVCYLDELYLLTLSVYKEWHCLSSLDDILSKRPEAVSKRHWDNWKTPTSVSSFDFCSADAFKCPHVLQFYTYTTAASTICFLNLLPSVLSSISRFLFGSATWQAWCCGSEESSTFRTPQTRADSPGWLSDVSLLTGRLGSVVLLCFVR